MFFIYWLLIIDKDLFSMIFKLFFLSLICNVEYVVLSLSFVDEIMIVYFCYFV